MGILEIVELAICIVLIVVLSVDIVLTLKERR